MRFTPGEQVVRMHKDHWACDIERVIEELSLGQIDSIEAVSRLQGLGFTPQEAIEDVLGDVEE